MAPALPPGVPGPPAKEKGPALSTVVSDNLAVAMAKTFRTAHKDVDIAIIKATTSKFQVVPKEKHVRTLKMAVHGGQPGSYAGYVITKLLDRLRDAKDWLCALKTLMVFHRLMRESEGATFVSELLKFGDHSRGHRGHALNMDSFIDTSSAEGRFDYSEWIRAYGRYLDEQLEVFSKTAFYQEAEGAAPAESKMRNLPPEELLAQLPPLQRLLERLIDALPRGAAARHYVVQAALLTVAKESFQIYRAISEGIINLADCFFDMEYPEAQRGLEIYKQHTLDNDRLGEFYAKAEQIDELKRSATFPKLTPPSPDFLGMMEEYVQAAPRPAGENGFGRSKSSPLRKGRNAGKDEGGKAELPPPIDSGLSGVIHPKEETPPPSPPAAPAPAPELDLLNFDDPEPEPSSPPPLREKTATELLEEEAAAAAAVNGTPQGNGLAAPAGTVPQQSTNPFGEGASFGQGQQHQQGGFGAGAVVPYGANTFGAGPGFGAQQYGQQYGGYGQPYGGGYGGGYGQPAGYGGYGGGAPIQPGAMVPYGLGSPGYGIHNSPLQSPAPQGGYSANRSPTPQSSYNRSPTPGGGPAQTQSFKDAALVDPFAELGPVAKPQPQTTPPLREVSPTQQRFNLGTQPSYGAAQQGYGAAQQGYGAPQQQQYGAAAPQQQQQQQGAAMAQPGQQQPQQNGARQQWANGGFASFPAPGSPAPATPSTGSNRW